ncbi:MAG: polysaccharide deacetylase family protein [Saprospiraceae bacterium]
MKQLSPPVLYFHSVAPRKFNNWVLNFLTMDLRRFEDQMRYFQANSYQSIFLDEWYAMRQGNRPVNPNALCITFDDGLLDNWVYAFPVAKKYGMRITLFVCPELIDPRDIVRPNLDDVWAGRCPASELNGLGNLSWAELRLMQESGFADVQSHTMSHAKHVVSDRLRGYYYGGFSGFYPILNSYSLPEKPHYIQDSGFEQRIPLGTPLFEENSAVVAQKHTISPMFQQEVAQLANKYDLTIVEHRPVFEQNAKQVYQQYQKSGTLVTAVESNAEFGSRLQYEVATSKKIIESNLKKPVRFLCWPHGDNSHIAHLVARETGYLATTAGKMTTETERPDRIPRIGTDWAISRWWMYRKLDYKLSSHHHKQPYYALWLANEYKNRLLKRS